jgi:hypothetical protein
MRLGSNNPFEINESGGGLDRTRICDLLRVNYRGKLFAVARR